MNWNHRDSALWMSQCLGMSVVWSMNSMGRNLRFLYHYFYSIILRFPVFIPMLERFREIIGTVEMLSTGAPNTTVFKVIWCFPDLEGNARIPLVRVDLKLCSLSHWQRKGFLTATAESYFTSVLSGVTLVRAVHRRTAVKTQIMFLSCRRIRFKQLYLISKACRRPRLWCSSETI